MPFDVDANAEEVALDWLHGVIWNEWTDDEKRSFRRGMQLAGIDLSGAVRKSRTRLNRIEDHLRQIMAEGGSRAVFDVMTAISLPPFEVLAELGIEIRKVGALIKSLKNFSRAAERLNLPPRLLRAIRSETKRKLKDLETTHRLGAALDLHIVRQRKRSPQRALPVVRLVNLFIRAGFTKRQAYCRTAELLRDFDAERYGELDADQVRLRHTRARTGPDGNVAD